MQSVPLRRLICVVWSPSEILLEHFASASEAYSWQILSCMLGQDLQYVLASLDRGQVDRLGSSLGNIIKRLRILPTNGKFEISLRPGRPLDSIPGLPAWRTW